MTLKRGEYFDYSGVNNQNFKDKIKNKKDNQNYKDNKI